MSSPVCVQAKNHALSEAEGLFEELFTSDENYARTSHEKIFVARNGTGEIQNSKSAIRHPPSAVDALIAAAQKGDAAEIRCLLQTIVPEYHPAEAEVEVALQTRPAPVAPVPGNLRAVIRPAEG